MGTAATPGEADTPPPLWSDLDVVSWFLRRMPFLPPRYFLSFRDKGVNGLILLDLTEAEIREHLGVEDPIHRKRILSEVALLRSSYAESSPRLAHLAPFGSPPTT